MDERFGGEVTITQKGVCIPPKGMLDPTHDGAGRHATEAASVEDGAGNAEDTPFITRATTACFL